MNTEQLINQIYPQFVQSRTKDLDSDTLNMLHMAVGISGEAGELLDAIKKVWIYQKRIDLDNVEEELGDLLFYIQGMANILELDIHNLIESNMLKLTKRYPTGYTDVDAIARADKEN